MNGRLHERGPHPASGGASVTFSLRAKSRLRRLRSDTRLRAQPRRGRLTAERLLPREKLRLSKKVCSPLGPLCEGAPPAGGGGENCTAVRNISGYGKVLSLRPFGAPLPLWRKRHLPRIGGVCLAEGGFSTRWASPSGEAVSGPVR